MTSTANIEEADLPRLAELYEELAGGEKPSLDAMREAFFALEKEGRYFLVGVWSGGELAGSAMGVVCRQLNRDARPFMVMENFIVSGKHRRKGLGRVLLAEIERIARENGCRSVVFLSNAKRKEAHAFYASAGYALDAVQGFKKYL